MKHRFVVDVRPLSELQKRQIEARVFRALDEPGTRVVYRTRRRPGTRVTGFAVAAAALVAAVAVGVHVRKTATLPSLAKTEEHIVTAATGSQVAIGGVHVGVGSHSNIDVMGSDEEGVVVVLEQGAVDCDVAPRGDRPPVWVQAGGVTVRVIGTRFRVERTGPSVQVAVEHGTVEVLADAQRWFVHSSERWTRAGAPPPVPPAPAAEDRSSESPIAPSSAPSSTAPKQGPARAGAPSANARFLEASRLEPTQPERALAIYDSLVAASGPWAPAALFAKAELLAELGRSSDARASLQRYLREYPSGPNAQDARHRLERLP